MDIDEDKEDIHTMAIHASKLDENQHKQWVQEMKSLGINF
jgi:hypothetical protein